MRGTSTLERVGRRSDRGHGHFLQPRRGSDFLVAHLHGVEVVRSACRAAEHLNRGGNRQRPAKPWVSAPSVPRNPSLLTAETAGIPREDRTLLRPELVFEGKALQRPREVRGLEDQPLQLPVRQWLGRMTSAGGDHECAGNESGRRDNSHGNDVTSERRARRYRALRSRVD